MYNMFITCLFIFIWTYISRDHLFIISCLYMYFVETIDITSLKYIYKSQNYFAF